MMPHMTNIKHHLFKSTELFYLMFYGSDKGRRIASSAVPIL